MVNMYVVKCTDIFLCRVSYITSHKNNTNIVCGHSANITAAEIWNNKDDIDEFVDELNKSQHVMQYTTTNLSDFLRDECKIDQMLAIQRI